MAALHGDEIVDVSLEEATAELKRVPRGVVRGRPGVLRLTALSVRGPWSGGQTPGHDLNGQLD